MEDYFRAKETEMIMVTTGKMSHFHMNLNSGFNLTKDTILFERYAFNKDTNGKYTIIMPCIGSQLVLKMKGNVPNEFRARKENIL